MPALNPSTKENLKIGAISTISGGFSGYTMYSMGDIGDFLDIANHKLVSKKYFQKHYKTI